jgi:Phosphatase
MSSVSRSVLREHLVATGIAGPVRTPVADVLRKAELVAQGDPEHCFGLSGMDAYTRAEVLEQVRLQFGWSPEVAGSAGGGAFIDPDLLLDELDRAAVRLARAGDNGERVIFASGHPTGVLSLHQQVAYALRMNGAKVDRPGDGARVQLDDRMRQVRYIQNVASLSSAANLYHTHDSRPMELVLDLAGPVDLVVGDHGWAGAAAERGIDVVAIADINDPALPMARAEGRASIVLPMDDNVLPASYDLVAAYLCRSGVD